MKVHLEMVDIVKTLHLAFLAPSHLHNIRVDYFFRRSLPGNEMLSFSSGPFIRRGVVCRIAKQEVRMAISLVENAGLFCFSSIPCPFKVSWNSIQGGVF